VLPSAWSQPAAFPEANRPISFIVPYPPGGGADFVGRLVADKLSTLWATPVIVANKPGADTVIASAALASSQKDGYTIGLMTNEWVLNRVLRKTLPYDRDKDFTFVGLVAVTPFFIVSNSTSKIQSFNDLVGASRREGDALNYGSCCTWTALQIERIKAASGIRGTMVPYKGSVAAITGVLAGETAYTLETVIATQEFVKAGKLKPLAVTTSSRLPAFPDVPTLGEVGLPNNLDITAWYGLMLPSGVSTEIVAKYNAAIKQILAMPDVQQKIEARNTQVVYSTGPEMAAKLHADTKALQDAMHKANMKMLD
jgi:tripartite-type tricarboxylate transporter receptor subunit TctC